MRDVFPGDNSTNHVNGLPIDQLEHAASVSASASASAFAANSLSSSSSTPYSQTSVRLVDDTLFDTIDTFELIRDEDIVSCLYATLEDDANFYFIVGTAFIDNNEPEPDKGRIIIFSVDSIERKFRMVYQHSVNGSCYNLNTFSNGKLVAGLGGTVNIYRWRTATTTANNNNVNSNSNNTPSKNSTNNNNENNHSKQLEWECGHSGHILALYIETRGDFIVCGDVMKSVSLLMYDPKMKRLVERARDHNANYMTAIAVLNDDVYLGAENSFNIFTVRKNADAANDEDRNRLDVVGEFHIGEFINRYEE